MAQLLTGPFNAMMYDPELGAPQFPLGMKQPMRIISEEVVAAKGNSNNGFIAFTCEILDGANKGATGVYRLNIYNSSEKATEMAMRQLSALSIACGKPTWQDSRELHNLPFLADITPQKETEQNAGKGYTEISAVYDVNGNKPKRGGAAGQNNNQQQQNNNGNNGNNGGGDWSNNNGQNQQNNNTQNDQQQHQQQQNNNTQTNNGGWDNSQQQNNNNGNNGGNNNGGNGGGGNSGGNGDTPPWMRKQG